MSNEIESIGVAMDTSGVERGIKSLETLAAAGPKVERAMGGVEGAATRTGKSLESLGQGKAATSLSKIGDAANSTARDMGRVNQASDQVSRGLSGMAANADLAAKAIASIGIAASVQQYLRVADAVTALNNSLKLSTGSVQAASAAYEDLFQIAQRSRIGFLQLGETYFNISRATGELGVSQARMLKVTESIANAMTIGGGSAQSMNAALVQLGQGLASGTLRGEELNSILEQAPRLAKALADGLGVPIGKLRELGSAGEITSQQIVKALESQSAVLAKEVAGATLTLGQAFTQLTNSGSKAVGEFDKASGASATLAQAISSVATAVDSMGAAFKNNAGTIQTVMGAVASVAAVASLGAVAKGIGTVGTAVGTLGAVLAAHPAVAVLLGVTAAVGAGVGAISAYKKTAEGISATIDALERENARAQKSLDFTAGMGANYQRGDDATRVKIEERTKAIKDLRAELALMSSAGLDNRAEEARLAAGTEQMQTQKRAAEELAGIKQKLSGVDKDYLPTLNKLFKQYQDGNIELGEYQRLVAKLAKDNFKTDSGASSALSDALDAKLQAYKNNDKAILDSRKAFYDAQALLVKLGGKSELDAIDESLAKEEEVWAQRKANFDAELAQAAKKKTSQAEVARITGQMQDAERDYEQNIAKLRAESALADAKSLDALEARVAGQEKASRAAMEQVRMAELEGKAIGLTGDALREFNQQQLESSIPLALKMQAAWADQAGALGDLGRAARDQIQAMRDLAKAQGENRAAQMVYEYAKGIEDSNRLLQAEIGLMGMSEQARTTALEQLRIQLDLEQKIAFVKANVADTDKQAADIAKLQASASIAKANAANKAFLEEWKTSVGKYDDIFRQGFADMLNNGKDGWKSFTKSLATTFKTTVADQLYKAFAQPFVVKMVGSLMGVFGGSGGIGGAAGAAGGAGGLSNVASLGMNAYSAYSNFAGASGLGGLSSFAGGYSGAILPAGMVGPSIAQPTILSGLGNSVSGFTGGAGGAGAGSAIAGAGAFAAVAAVVLNALGAFKSERKVGGGLMGTLGSGSISPWEEWREGGTLFSGPSYSTFNPIAELDKAREKEKQLRETGADSGRIAIQQMIVRNLEDQYGGLAEATAAQSKVIQSAFDAMRKSAGDMADVLGLSSDAARNFTTQLGGDKGLNFDGLKPEEQQAKLAEALATANNEIAQQLIGTWETTTTEINRIVSENIGSAGEDMSIVYTELTDAVTKTRYVASEYAKDGEKAIDTLTRLASSLSTVNTIWDQLGNDMLQASLAGADAASRIAEAFGGLEAMSATTGSYFQNFYGADEQRDAMRRQIQGQLDKLNLTLPDIDAANAREQYRALAEAQDRNTEEGLKAYVALLQLSGSFASLTQAAQTTTQTLEQQRQAYYGALQDAVSARNKSLQSQLSAAQEVESTLDNLFGILRSNVRELYGEVDGTRGMLATQGGAFIDQALASAKKSGYLPDADKLAEAISAVRGGIDGGGYTSQFALDRDRLVLAGKLSGLEKITEKQLTDAQKTVRALETQIDQNEQTLDYWKQQIDIASGTYEGILSVEAAVQQLQASLNPTAGKPGGANTVGGGSTPASGTGAIPRTSYGADEALTSFEKFKAWYTGLKSNADPSKTMGDGYQVPDWLRVSNFGADSYSEKDLFGSYLFFKNNPQYAQDYQQILDTGRSSYATDGSTLLRTDLSKLPADIADFYKGNKDALAMTEGFGLDPVLAYQLYNTGAAQFGLDQSKQSFTEWLQTNKWTPDGIVSSNNVLDLAKQNYPNYKLPRWDVSTGNIVDTDGTIYSVDGTRIGRATQAQLDAIYGVGYKPTGGATSGEDDYLSNLKNNVQDRINEGWSAQQLADALIETNTSLKDVADAYGISVEQVKENLLAGGATNIPKFAVGTNYVPRDMLAYIHEGEQIIPKAYNPAANPGMASGNDELLVEVRALREAVAALEAAASATAKNTAGLPQMADQFDTVAANGVVRVATA